MLVCGAGCAGIAAALACARSEVQTLLIELAPFAGGIITCAGLPHFDGVGRKKDGVVVTRGIPLELLARMGVCKLSDKVIRPYNEAINSIERFKIVVDELLRAEPNLQVLYHVFAVDVVVKDDRIAEVLIAGKAGLQRIRATTVIDTTGDADLAARAGVPLDHSREYMPLTLHFRLGNVA